MVGKLGFDAWSSDLSLTVPTTIADQLPLCLRLSTFVIHRHPQNRRHYIVERALKKKNSGYWDFPCFCFMNLDFVVVECVQFVAK